MKTDRRFKGRMSDEYDLIRRVIPHFDMLQNQVAAKIAGLKNPKPKILEIGCGNGLTTAAILSARPDASVIALDNEPKMIIKAKKNLQTDIRHGRCDVIHADALQFASRLPRQSVDAVASAMTLHNLNSVYRAKLHRQIHRVLVTGGIFVNADKYAPQSDADRFAALAIALKRFFDTFVPLKKYKLLEEWVLHNVADQGPDRVMKQQDVINELLGLGFAPVTLSHRNNMEAVLSARKSP
jgi:tRNA (cmo5U34)-methyltransferase